MAQVPAAPSFGDLLTYTLFHKSATALPEQATGQTVTGVVTGNLNATSADGATMIYAVTRSPANGSVELNQDGSYTYTPDLQTALSGGTGTFTATIDNGSAYRLTGIGGIIQGILSSIAQAIGLRQPDVVAVQVPVSVASTIVTIPVGTSAWGVAVSPDGRFVYTANYDDDAVAVVDTTTATKVRTIPFGEFPSCSNCKGPESLAVSPDGRLLYAVGGEIPVFNPDGSINFYEAWAPLTVIDTTSGAITSRLDEIRGYGPLAISPDGQKIYLNGLVFDVATNTSSSLGKPTWTIGAIALSEDGATISSLPRISGSVVSMLELATNTELWQTGLYRDGRSHYLYAVAAAKDRIYVGENNGQLGSTGTAGVAVFDAANGNLVASIKTRDGDANAVGASYGGSMIAASPDGKRVFLLDPAVATLSIIDTTTNTLVLNHILGGSPWGVTVSPDNKYVYVTNRATGTLSVIPV